MEISLGNLFVDIGASRVNNWYRHSRDKKRLNNRKEMSFKDKISLL